MKNGTTLDDRIVSVAALLDGFNATWVIATITRSGILKAICESPGISTAQIARELGYLREPVEVLCRAAYAIGLLEYRAGRGWYLAAFVKETLVDHESLSYMGGFFWYAVAASREYGSFLQFLTQRKPVKVEQRSEQYVVGIEEGGKSAYRFFLEVVVPQTTGLAGCLRETGSVLEIGCGSGAGMEMLVSRFSSARITGIDIDGRAIERARRRLKGKSYVNLIEGPAERMTFNEEFNLALMVFTLHELDHPIAVLRLSYKALTHGGYLISLDLPFMEDLQDYPKTVGPTMALLQFGEVLQGTPLLSNSKVEQMVREAGFTEVSWMQVHPLLHAMVARK